MKQPKLRFKDDNGNTFPNWKTKKIKEIFNITVGGDVNLNDFSKIKTSKYTVPILANSLENDGIYGYTSVAKVTAPSITVSGRGEIGVAKARYEDYTPIVRLLNLKANQDIDYYFFENAINKIRILKESTGVPQLTAPQLGSYKVSFPELEEQQKIGSFLSTVDRRIDLQRRLVDETRRLKTSVSQMLFSQKVRFKDDDGRKYPKPKDVRLVDITTYSSSNLLLSDVLKANEGNYLVYDATGPIKRIPYFVSEKPYIGIVKDGAVGRLFLCEAKTSVVSTFGMIYNKKEVSLEFVYHFMNQINFKKFILGSTIPHVYYKDYSKITMPLPTINEQIKISRVLTLLDDKIKKEEEKLLALEALKKGLLQQMFV